MIHHLLCEIGLHSWSRWEIEHVTKWDGMKPKEVSAQTRECIYCAFKEYKLIRYKESK